MKSYNKTIFILGMSIFISTILYAVPPKDNFILINGSKLTAAKVLYQSGEYKKNPAIKKILKDADKVLAGEPYSIMDKEQIPPSGSKHDYCTLARYYWPNPKTADGLPYVQKDGEVNPEINTSSDLGNLQRLCREALPIAVAYFITSDEKYADKGVETFKRWFVDTTTKMNPNLEYSQVIKGSNKLNYSGIIDGNQLTRVLDAVSLYSGSKAMTPEIRNGINLWFESYLKWLNESEQGKRERQSTNNHGTWYNQDIAAIAFFLGKTDFAKKVCEEAKSKLIDVQITAEGTQPKELVRTRSLHYYCYNLEALTKLAKIAQKVDVDLWNYNTPDGGGIHKALDYVTPFLAGEKNWEGKQIDKFKINSF